MRHTCPDRQTAKRTHICARLQFRDWLLSAKRASPTEAFLSFSAWQTLRWWWCPICLCTFKGARPHTRSVFIQVDACSRNKLNQMSALQTSFQIPRLHLPPHPDLLFCSPKSFLIQQPQTFLFFTLFFILLVVLCAPVLISQSTLLSVGVHRAVPTQTSAADGRATQAQHKQNSWKTQNLTYGHSEWTGATSFKRDRNFYCHLSIILICWAIRV